LTRNEEDFRRNSNEELCINPESVPPPAPLPPPPPEDRTIKRERSSHR
jgi:hypothetical protein